MGVTNFVWERCQCLGDQDGGRKALSAEGEIQGKKVQNWVASFGEVVCMECRMHGHSGISRGLKVWLQLNREVPKG